MSGRKLRSSQYSLQESQDFPTKKCIESEKCRPAETPVYAISYKVQVVIL